MKQKEFLLYVREKILCNGKVIYDFILKKQTEIEVYKSYLKKTQMNINTDISKYYKYHNTLT